MQDQNLPPTLLTPEQLAAIQAGQGIAHVQDPATHRVYLLIEQGLQPALSEEYFRAKLEEGLVESRQGKSVPWNVDESKNNLRYRYAAKHSQS